jgi:hypothetical protein
LRLIGRPVPLKKAQAVAKPQRTSPQPIPKARRLRTSPLSRKDVTRAEYNRIIDILNERNQILNALRDAVKGLEHVSDIQFKRIAQVQADVDRMVQALDRKNLLT